LEREEFDDQENDEVQISKEERQLNDYMKSKASDEDKRLDSFDYWLKPFKDQRNVHNSTL